MRRSSRIVLVVVLCTAIAGFEPARAGGPSGDEMGKAFSQWNECQQRIPAGGAAPASAFQWMFVRPSNISQLLQNLKLMWERDLLLEPNMYSEGPLQSAFDGTNVTWKASDIARDLKSGYAAVELTTGLIQGVSVRVESRCWRTDRRQPVGGADSEVNIIGFMHMTGVPISNMTLRDVREVFGQEAENTIDTGISEHGYAYTPTEKGSVIYRLRPASNLTGLAETSRALGTTFRFQIHPPQPGSISSNKIEDEDIVQSVEIVEAQRRRLGN